MGQFVTVTVDDEPLKKKIAALKDVASGRSDVLKPAWLDAGLSLLADIRTAYKDKSRGGADDAGITWNPISWITYLFRPKGSGAKVGSWQELKDRTKPATSPIGTNTGGQFQSLTPGQPTNVLEAESLAVTVGTAHQHASRFHAGGQADPFVLTDEMYQRVKTKVVKPRNLTKKQLKEIREGDALGEDWRPRVDPQYEERAFRRDVFSTLFGMHAKKATPSIPARPITPDDRIPQSWVGRAVTAFSSGARLIIRKIGGGQ